MTNLIGRVVCRDMAASVGAFLQVWDDIQSTIDRLHLLGYLERVSWSRAIDIPANGLLIHSNSGDVLRYSQRDRPTT